MLLIMLTGLSGAGKTTLSVALQNVLTKQNIVAEVLDGDQYRNTLHQNLGFSEADRKENINRLVQIAITKKNVCDVCIIAAINPFEDQRKQIAELYNAKIIWVSCNLQKLIEKDTKGLYKRAMLPSGHPEKIENLTGINSRYDEPVNPSLKIDTTDEDVQLSIEKLVGFVKSCLRSN